jgi:hypothetical protein
VVVVVGCVLGTLLGPEGTHGCVLSSRVLWSSNCCWVCLVVCGGGSDAVGLLFENCIVDASIFGFLWCLWCEVGKGVRWMPGH